MKWLELSVRAPSEFVEPLSQVFLRYGHGGVVVEEAPVAEAEAVVEEEPTAEAEAAAEDVPAAVSEEESEEVDSPDEGQSRS